MEEKNLKGEGRDWARLLRGDFDIERYSENDPRRYSDRDPSWRFSDSHLRDWAQGYIDTISKRTVAVNLKPLLESKHLSYKRGFLEADLNAKLLVGNLAALKGNDPKAKAAYLATKVTKDNFKGLFNLVPADQKAEVLAELDRQTIEHKMVDIAEKSGLWPDEISKIPPELFAIETNGKRTTRSIPVSRLLLNFTLFSYRRDINGQPIDVLAWKEPILKNDSNLTSLEERMNKLFYGKQKFKVVYDPSFTDYPVRLQLVDN